MKSKKKICDRCGENRYIWKNITENGTRKRFCKYCWSAHKSDTSSKPTANKILFRSHSPIKKRSTKRSRQETEYNKKARAFKEANPYCQIGIPGICSKKTHDVHHMKGRENNLLLAEEYWKATCRQCHEWVTIHTQEAIDLGYSLSRSNEKK